MTENDLGKALLNLDTGELSATSELRRESERLRCNNQRWMRLLTVLAVLFSLLAIGVFMLFWLFHYKLEPIMESVYSEMGQQVYGPLEAPKSTTDYDAVAAGLFWMFRCWWVSLACVAGALVGLVLAGIATVWLILASRRATIRHVNPSLIEISEQLKRLQLPTTEGGSTCIACGRVLLAFPLGAAAIEATVVPSPE